MELLLQPASIRRLNISGVSSVSPSQVTEGQTDGEIGPSGRLGAAVEIPEIKAWEREREGERKFTKVNSGFGLGGSCFSS